MAKRSNLHKLRIGSRIQLRVVQALIIRELSTRFGRENIGFLWIMGEPLLFASLVALMWRLMKGPEEHGVGVVAFVLSGYFPLTFFRHCVSRSVSIFVANGGMMYHQQIKILDFVFVRFLIELVGTMMAFFFVAILLIPFDVFPMPVNLGMFLGGWFLYAAFVLSLCFMIAPLSEMSEVWEKIIPVTTYIMIPISGSFSMVSWLTPTLRDYLLWSPFVNAMELMRGGLWGEKVTVYYDVWTPLVATMIASVVGLALCRRIRRTLVVE